MCLRKMKGNFSSIVLISLSKMDGLKSSKLYILIFLYNHKSWLKTEEMFRFKHMTSKIPYQTCDYFQGYVGIMW